MGIGRRVGIAGLVASMLICGGTDLLGQNRRDHPKAVTVPDDVVIGKPIITPYSRLFPLFDGLFQDYAAMQVTALQANANATNASNLNAVLQQLQITAQYSQTAGIQNAVVAQQYAVSQQANALQSSLIKSTVPIDCTTNPAILRRRRVRSRLRPPPHSSRLQSP